MIHDLTKDSISNISGVLGVTPKINGKVHRFEIKDQETGRKMAFEIHLDLELDGASTNMISVYSQNTFLQLHNCSGFIASDILNQVTFFGRDQDRISGLIVEKEGGCSLYANVNEDLLKSDFTKLPPEVMMCSVALSLTDSLDMEGFSFDND